MTLYIILMNLLVLLHVVWAAVVVVMTIQAFLGRLHQSKWLTYYAGALLLNVVLGSLLMHFPLQVAKLSAQVLMETGEQVSVGVQVLLQFLGGYAAVVNDLTVFIVANALMAAGFTVAFGWHLKERGLKLMNLDRTTLRIMALALILIIFSTVPFIVARAQQQLSFDCTGLVDLNYLVDSDYIGALPVDPVGMSENGTGYEIYRKGNTINISAPQAEQGEVIWVRR